MRLFLYGTLVDADALVAHGRQATLARHGAAAALDGWQHVAKRGGGVDGLLLTVSARALAEQLAYEDLAYRVTPVVVTTRKGKTATHAWIAADATRRTWKE